MSIILDHVTYTYMPKTPFEKTALSDINLSIQAGEFVGIIGHTGSGKSTLIQHMNGLLTPTDGKVTLDGIDINQKNPVSKAAKRRIGMVFQYPEHQLFEETIAADIAFGPKSMGLTAGEVDERVRYAMNFVNMDYDEFAQRSPFELSGGQMRRVSIAGIVALKPEYLILDEPSAGLDPGGRKEIFREIMKYHRESGATVVLVSHNMDEVAQLADRLVVMDQGKVMIDGKVKEVFSEHRSRLHEAGVDVPPITKLLETLSEQGLRVDSSLTSVQAAVDNIDQALRRRRHAH